MGVPQVKWGTPELGGSPHLALDNGLFGSRSLERVGTPIREHALGGGYPKPFGEKESQGYSCLREAIFHS